MEGCRHIEAKCRNSSERKQLEDGGRRGRKDVPEHGKTYFFISESFNY